MEFSKTDKFILKVIKGRIEGYKYQPDAKEYVAGLTALVKVMEKVGRERPAPKKAKPLRAGDVVMVKRTVRGEYSTLEVGDLAVVIACHAHGFVVCDTGAGFYDWYLREGEYEVL